MLLTEKTLVKCLRKISYIFPHSFKLDCKEALDAWFDALSDIPESAVEAAFKILARECSGFPTPADVRRHAVKLIAPDMNAVFMEIVNNSHRVIYPVFKNGKKVDVQWSSKFVQEIFNRCGGANTFLNLESSDVNYFLKQSFEPVYNDCMIKMEVCGDAISIQEADRYNMINRLNKLLGDGDEEALV